MEIYLVMNVLVGTGATTAASSRPAIGRRDWLRTSPDRRSCRRDLVCARQDGPGTPPARDALEQDLRDALDSLMRIEARIRELQALLAAEPLEASLACGAGAQLGATVTLRLPDGEEASYVLVSPAEAAPRRGRLSVASPIGRALVGAKPGDEVVAQTPSGPGGWSSCA